MSMSISISISVLYYTVVSASAADMMTNCTVHSGAVQSCSFNRAGDLLATSGSDMSLVIWSVTVSACAVLYH